MWFTNVSARLTYSSIFWRISILLFSFLSSCPYLADVPFFADYVYDDTCEIVETLIYTGSNPCTDGSFSCSPPPITITGANILGSWYECRTDPRSGSCGHKINVCVSSPACVSDGVLLS